MKKFILTLTLVLSSGVNAALIDNGTYTTDDISGLDWLDLTATLSQNLLNAESLNLGWRIASNTEVEYLFTTSFTSYVDTNVFAHTASAGSGGNLYNEALVFANLFGGNSIYNSGSLYSYGHYYDEDGLNRMMGVYTDAGTSASIYSDEFTTYYAIDYPSPLHGVFMVRASVVPIPAAVWLFGSGLIGLFGIAKRNKI